MVSRHNTAIRIYETKMQTPAAKVLISAFWARPYCPAGRKTVGKVAAQEYTHHSRSASYRLIETVRVTAEFPQRKGVNDMQLRVGQKIEDDSCQVRQLESYQKDQDKAAGSHQPAGKEFLEHGGRCHEHNGTTRLAFHPFHGKRGANASPNDKSPKKESGLKLPDRVHAHSSRFQIVILIVSIPDKDYDQHSVDHHRAEYIGLPILHHLFAAYVHKAMQTKKVSRIIIHLF